MLSERIHQVADRYPAAVDGALGLVIGAASFLTVSFGPDGQPQPTPTDGDDLIVAAILFVAVAVRRRWPWPSLAIGTAGAAAFSIFGAGQPVLLAAIAVAAYTIAVRHSRRTAWLAAGGAALIVYLSSVRWPADSWIEPGHPLIFASIGMATAFGDATRSRRAYIAEVEDRARRAEHTRLVEARQQVAEERLRIARELHDVVAHHIAVINVQVGAAAYVLQSRPDQVGPALGHIRRASDTVLREMAAVVGVLRTPDGLEVDVQPTRGLDRLAGLLDSLAAAGLPVDLHRSGEPRELPPMIDLAAFRIIQEALTNAHKHGAAGPARLDLAYTAEAVTIHVTNPMRRPDTLPADLGHGLNGKGAAFGLTGEDEGLGLIGNGEGFGLIGMGERAAATGGTLTTGPGRDGRFEVCAVLPDPAR